MKAALRLGLIYWAVLLLVFALGHRNQVEKEANARLERELQALEAQKAALVMEGGRLVSTDPTTRLSYEIRDSIPIMLIDEAQELPESAWQEIMRKQGRDPRTGAPAPGAG